MQEFLATVPVPGSATFFCTHRYESLTEPHEICPHPVLDEERDWATELSAKRAEFPDAIGWRSHSCIYSHLIAERVAASGYLYASTQYQPLAPARPFREPWGIWHMPVYYMDNMDFSRPRFWPDAGQVPFSSEVIDTALADDGVYVFDFHPIHLLLNSTSADAYFERRDAFLRGERLETLRCEGRGARTFYDELCAKMERRGTLSVRMKDALAPAVGAAAPEG